MRNGLTEQQGATQKPGREAAKRAPEPRPKSECVTIVGRPGVSDERVMTDVVADGDLSNASTALRFVRADLPDLSLTDMVASLREHGEAVNRGDLSAAERMLNSQAVALNAIFGEMARRAALNIGTHLGATESYMRLALKAQGQCRATVETLAAIKNPPVVFARQANIAHGPQQVNNGVTPGPARPEELPRPSMPPGLTLRLRDQYAEARAPAEIPKAEHSELLERPGRG